MKAIQCDGGADKCSPRTTNGMLVDMAYGPSCPVDRSPVCVCGHGRARHQLDFNDGDTCEPWCDCTRFCYPRQPTATDRGWSRCLDLCNCGAEHIAGRVYFVSVRATTEYQLVLGPFATHGEALENVDRGRALAEKHDPWSQAFFFGTCSLPGDTKQIGVLDDRYAAPVDAPRGDS